MPGRVDLDRIADAASLAPTTQLRAVAGLSTGANPDQLAKDIDLSSSTGVPLPVVERNRDQVQRQADMDRYEQFAQRSPGLASFLTADKNNARIAHDDTSALEHIEGFFRRAAKNVYAGVTSDLAAGTYGALEYLARTTRGTGETLAGSLDRQKSELWASLGIEPTREYVPPDLVALFGGLRQESQAISQGLRAENAKAGAFEQNVYSGLSSLAMNAPFIALAAITRNPYVAIAGLSGESFGQSYGEAIDAGYSHETASIYATTVAMVEGGTEFIPQTKLIKDLAGNTGFFKALLGQVVSENIEEQFATHIQDALKWFYLEPDKTLADFIEERPEAFMQTLIATTVAAGGQTAIAYGTDRGFRALADRSARADRAQATKELLGEMGAVAQNSALRERSPGKFAEFVRTLSSKIDAVYIPIERFDEYFQDAGISPGAMATDILGSRAAYDEAEGTGADLRIPIDKYMASLAASDHHAGLTPYLKFQPNDMTADEATNYQENVVTMAEELRNATTVTTETDALAEDIIGQLLSTGVYDSSATETQGEVVRASIRQAAEKLKAAGVDIAQMPIFQQLRITAPQDYPEYNAIDLAIDPLIDRLRSGDIPSQKDIFGESLTEFLRRSGGLMDQGGELAASDIRQSIRGLVKQDGLTLDHAAELAMEQQYITSATEGALLEAVRREAGGEPVYRPGANEQLQGVAAQLSDLEEFLGMAGVDIQTASNKEIKQLLRQMEMGQVSRSQDFGGIELLEEVELPNGDTAEVRQDAQRVFDRASKKVTTMELFVRCVGGT